MKDMDTVQEVSRAHRQAGDARQGGAPDAADGGAQAEVRRLRAALAELERDKRFVEGLLARRDHQFAQLQKQWRAKRRASLSYALRRARGAIGRMFGAAA